MPKLEIEQLPVLDDNYSYLLHDTATGKTAVVDPGEPGPILEALKRRGWALDFILCTHHHWDHTGGNLALKAATGAVVAGHAADAERIPGLSLPLRDGEPFRLGETEAIVRDTSGHTLGHINYWLPEIGAVFTGDTLFLMGCGRLFEGTAQQMWKSLSFYRGLPADTLVYCGHEYTEANSRFALTIEPHNGALLKRATAVKALRAKGMPTVPAAIAEELATNPFLRASEPELQRAMGMDGAPPDEVFAEIRRRKDHFKE